MKRRTDRIDESANELPTLKSTPKDEKELKDEE